MAELYGVMAEFNNADELVEAVRRTRAAGFRRFDAYSPFPIDDMPEALQLHRGRMAYFVAGGGVLGAIAGYGVQYYASVIHYPLNVGGRPLHSVPAFIPITFEMIILFAALGGVAGMFVLNRLPMPYHPVFNVPEFARVTRDGFFLCIEAADPQFEAAAVSQFLESLDPVRVVDVAP